MAKFNLNNYTTADGLGFPLNFRRGNPNPLDNSSVWASLEAAQNYAATDPVAYVGQILTVVDSVNGIAIVYAIQDEAGTLKRVGSSPIGDESTITVAEDGTVSLYGVSGLELTRTDEGGAVTKITYQPLLVDGKLTWVEPSATTVEGLATEIESLKARITAVEAAVGDAENGLAKDVADNATAIDAVNDKIGDVTEDKTIVEMITESDAVLSDRITVIENDYLKAEDRTALEAKIVEEAAQAKTDAITAIMGEAGIDEKYDTLKEVADWILSDTTASAELITRVSNIENDYLKGADKTELQSEIDALETFVGTIPDNATSMTVVAYIKEVVDGLKIGDYAKATDLATLVDRVKALEDVEAEKNIINSVDITQFNISDDRKLTLQAVAIDTVTGLSSVLDGKVDKVEGSRLITSDEATKLGKLVLSEDGTVSISGEISASNVKELGSWITTNRDTVPGLFSAVDATKLSGIENGAQANVLEAVSIDGVALAIDNKTVNIPLATAGSAGALSAVDKAFIDSIKDTYATKAEMQGLSDKIATVEESLTWTTI